MYNINIDYEFEWDLRRELDNINKHKVSFIESIEVFADPDVIHLEDVNHSLKEHRFYAVGRVKSGRVITVRYTVRGKVIRIFGAADWRKWRKFYEKKNSRSK